MVLVQIADNIASVIKAFITLHCTVHKQIFLCLQVNLLVAQQPHFANKDHHHRHGASSITELVYQVTDCSAIITAHTFRLFNLS